MRRLIDLATQRSGVIFGAMAAACSAFVLWLGLGLMTEQQVTFPLGPVYSQAGIRFEQARAVSIHPEGSADKARPWKST